MPSPLSPSNPWWHPEVGLAWQWQIGDLDIDLYVDQPIIDELHAKGRKVICYISVGSWEDWRPDKDQFPPEVLGKDYEGWPGEKWSKELKFSTILKNRELDAWLKTCP